MDESSSDTLDSLVTLIQNQDAQQQNSREIITLIDNETVNRQVNGLPLILYYLNTISNLDIKTLEKLANYCCDLNVQDAHGRTPLHWLVWYSFNKTWKRSLTSLPIATTVELFLAKGANPCLVDDDGNNVLMMAVLYQRRAEVFSALTENMTMTPQLLMQKNKAGLDALSLCFSSNVLVSEILPLLEEIGFNLNDVDHHGNTILHNLYLRKAYEYQPTVDYSNRSEAIEGNIDIESSRPNNEFVNNLWLLIESSANVSLKNNDGFVPLQLAILSFTQIESDHLKQLDLLIPTSDILAERVLWPRPIIATVLANYSPLLMPLLETLTLLGLDCSAEQVLPRSLELTNCSAELITMLIVRGRAVPTVSDIKYALQEYLACDTLLSRTCHRKYKDILFVLLRNAPTMVVVELTDAIPELNTVLFNRILDTSGIGEYWLGKKLVLRVRHYKQTSGSGESFKQKSIEIITLSDKETVNKHVNGLPLILYYINKISNPAIETLDTFANNGCDLNVQDVQGRTPLHWLMWYIFNRTWKEGSLTSTRTAATVELFLAKGAYPCLVDGDGNNALMMAVLYNQRTEVFNGLTNNMPVTRQLLKQKNKAGLDVLLLCFSSDVLVSDILLLLPQLRFDLNDVDRDGNTILHNVYLKRADKYQPTVYYSNSKVKGGRFTRQIVRPGGQTNLRLLIESGANVSVKNGDGLIPLQVALSSLKTIDPDHLKQLDLLIPTAEIITELAPWPHSIIATILYNYSPLILPLLEKLIKSGLNCSAKQVLPTALAVPGSSRELIAMLTDLGGSS